MNDTIDHFSALKIVIDAIDLAPDSYANMRSMMVFILAGLNSLDSSQVSDAIQEAFLIFENEILPAREKRAERVAAFPPLTIVG